MRNRKERVKSVLRRKQPTQRKGRKLPHLSLGKMDFATRHRRISDSAASDPTGKGVARNHVNIKLARRPGLLTNRQVFLHTARLTFIATLARHTPPIATSRSDWCGPHHESEVFPGPRRAPRDPIPTGSLLHSNGTPSLGSAEPWRVLRRASHGTTGKNAPGEQVEKERRLAPRAHASRLFSARDLNGAHFFLGVSFNEP